MAKESTKTNINLPAYTNIENIIILINSIKLKNKNEDETKAIFAKGETAYSSSKSALKAFGIIKNESLEFTDAGRNIAFSSDEDRKEMIFSSIRHYAPYELIFNKLGVSTNNGTTDIEEIKNLWGKANYGSNDRNRKEAATLFMGIVDFLGLGKFVKGTKGISTRIEWVEGIREKISTLHDDVRISEQCEENTAEANGTELDTSPIEPNGEDEILTFSEKIDVNEPRYVKKTIAPTINISVDISDWSNDKIKTFFMYAHGIFEED